MKMVHKMTALNVCVLRWYSSEETVVYYLVGFDYLLSKMLLLIQFLTH